MCQEITDEGNALKAMKDQDYGLLHKKASGVKSVQSNSVPNPLKHSQGFQHPLVSLMIIHSNTNLVHFCEICEANKYFELHLCYLFIFDLLIYFAEEILPESWFPPCACRGRDGYLHE